MAGRFYGLAVDAEMNKSGWEVFYVKVFLKVVLFVFLAFAVIGAAGIIYLSQGLKTGAQVVVHGVDLSRIDDGTYIGEYKVGRWNNEVSVEVQNHQITQIAIIKDVTFVKPEISAELFDAVIANQKVDVDVIAGSTVTCKAYLKAIENALIQN